MNHTIQPVIWALVCVLVLSIEAPAQAEWYNPWTWGQTSAKKKVTRQEPSTLQKVNHSTKQFFVKTADFLNPFDDSDSKPKHQRTSYSSGYSALKSSKNSSWGFGSWFAPEPAPPPETVSDFMALPRPKF